jgi:hypothetical protein
VEYLKEFFDFRLSLSPYTHTTKEEGLFKACPEVRRGKALPKIVMSNLKRGCESFSRA